MIAKKTIIALVALVALGAAVCGAEEPAELDAMLLKASLAGDTTIAKDLLRKGADANFLCGGLTPLIAACIGGHKETAEALLKSGAEVDKTSPDGPTALMQASASGQLDLVKLLLSCNPDVERKSAYVWSEVTLDIKGCDDLEKMAAAQERCEEESACMTAASVAKNQAVKDLITASVKTSQKRK